MKNKIIPFTFDNYLVLSLSNEWIEKFTKIPEFTWKVDRSKKLHITSTTSIMVKKDDVK